MNVQGTLFILLGTNPKYWIQIIDDYVLYFFVFHLSSFLESKAMQPQNHNTIDDEIKEINENKTLIKAARNQNVILVQSIMKIGADVNVQDENGSTPCLGGIRAFDSHVLSRQELTGNWSVYSQNWVNTQTTE